MPCNNDSEADYDEGDEGHEAYGYDVEVLHCRARRLQKKLITEFAYNIMQQPLPTSNLPIGSSKVHEQTGT